jgi:hypothetical protein
MRAFHFIPLLLSLLHLQSECKPLPNPVVIDTLETLPLPTCSAISGLVESVDDLKAKKRAEPGVCPNESYHLLKRQAASTTDDYSCGPSNPCKNGACCAKTGV